MNLLVITVIGYLAVINIVGFAMMAWDKYRAVRAGWRVPESTLMSIAAIGGSIGVFLGMRMFRHKTRHTKFSVGVPAIMVTQLAIAGYLYSH